MFLSAHVDAGIYFQRKNLAPFFSVVFLFSLSSHVNDILRPPCPFLLRAGYLSPFILLASPVGMGRPAPSSEFLVPCFSWVDLGFVFFPNCFDPVFLYYCISVFCILVTAETTPSGGINPVCAWFFLHYFLPLSFYLFSFCFFSSHHDMCLVGDLLTTGRLRRANLSINNHPPLPPICCTSKPRNANMKCTPKPPQRC